MTGSIFIARLDDALDWLPTNSGEDNGCREFITTVDAIVMGRRIFEKVLTFGAWPYGKKQVIVLSGNPSAVAMPAGAVCEAMAGTTPFASGLVQSEYRIAP